ALEAGARVIVLSHLGRPNEGEFDANLSLVPVAQALSKALGQEVPLWKDWLDLEKHPFNTPAKGQIVLVENVRFLQGEKNNDIGLAKQMAAACDVFVMDAFATAHRREASTYGIAEFAQVACAGPLLETEVAALTQAFHETRRPLVAIVGGSKVSTKIQLLESLIKEVDVLIVGGGIANTLLVAAGFKVGQSLYEADWVEPAKKLLQLAQDRGVAIPLPVDVVVAKEFSAEAEATVKSVSEILPDDRIFDVGPLTIQTYLPAIAEAGTIIWNGPVGVFEWEAFSHGTQALALAIAESKAFSIAGGGDTLAALDKFNVHEQISYVSTGGGAFLEFIEQGNLPAISILQKRGSVCPA
ncbi:MAG TPA: phosphoglycerate kinase, partial [Coxiellaceae bacterium]|nr:phosphoglycerate kinase [Coxiellaceae bacterium]